MQRMHITVKVIVKEVGSLKSEVEVCTNIF